MEIPHTLLSSCSFCKKNLITFITQTIVMKKIFPLFLLLLVTFTAFTQYIPRSNPEAEGIASSAIIQFIDSFKKDKHEPHSLMIIRHGKVISAGWWSPYASELKHSMYSVSKSWTSTAIGFAVDEKKITVADKVLSFFPEYKDIADKPYLAELTIKDLLTMSVGHEKEQFETVFMQADWTKAFLSLPIVNKPGAKFLYNTLATYTLSAIVQKVTGQSVMEYLTPRLFTPLGISGDDWEVNYKGINTGGWGFRDKTEDMAKLGLLYLNHGNYNGKQILSQQWVNEATSKQIEQKPDAPQSEKDASDWLQGYGYQFWRCRHNAFRADGAFGQYIVMMPEQDAVVVITSESLDLKEDLNMIWRNLLPAFEKNALPANPTAQALLAEKTTHLHLDPPVSSIKKGDQHLLNNTFSLTTNTLNFSGISIEKKNKKTHRIPLGFKQWQLSETDLVGPYLLRLAPVNFSLLGNYKLASSYRWLDAATLELTVRYIESPHHWTMTLKMENNKLKLTIINSYSPETIMEISSL